MVKVHATGSKVQHT